MRHGNLLKTITARWVYQIKPSQSGQPPRHKARLVARGFEQTPGDDYHKTFASVVKWETILVVSGLAAYANWSIRHLDVETAFLNGLIGEEVFLQQLLGFVISGQKHRVCKNYTRRFTGYVKVLEPGIAASIRSFNSKDLHAAVLTPTCTIAATILELSF